MLKLVTVFVAVGLAVISAHANTVLKEGATTLEIDNRGCPIRLQNDTRTSVGDCTQGIGRVVFGKQSIALVSSLSISQNDHAIGVAYNVPTSPSFILAVGYSIVDRNGESTLVRQVSIRRTDGRREIPADLTLELSNAPGHFEAREAWLPLKNGTGIKADLTKSAAIYRAAGRLSAGGSELAIPLVIGSTQTQPVVMSADPSFSTEFGASAVRWTYPHEVGLEDGTERRYIYSTFLKAEADIRALSENAISAFYKTALSNVPAGPAWLHQISLVTYDYMSDGGKGWYNDIAVLAQRIPPEQRSKVLLTLHGWFDINGRFAFTPGHSSLDSSWQSFRPGVGQLTVNDIRVRLQYAKNLGFRTGLYFANSMNTSSAPQVEIARDPSHILREQKNGWRGPDMAGYPAVILNPDHPDVFNHFVQLANAEVNAFGDLVDAYVSDESFYIQAGDLGPAARPGYADRAFMRLVQEIGKTIHSKYPAAAFLTSDDIGLAQNVPPYALFSDGTYQDARMEPVAWSYAIFPNYRNTVFGCNWGTVKWYDKMEFGVRNYQAPVVVTNGWEDDRGISEMDAALQDKYFDLFNWRSQFDTHLKWFDQLPVFPNAKVNEH